MQIKRLKSLISTQVTNSFINIRAITFIFLMIYQKKIEWRSSNIGNGLVTK